MYICKIVDSFFEYFVINILNFILWYFKYESNINFVRNFLI